MAMEPGKKLNIAQSVEYSKGYEKPIKLKLANNLLSTDALCQGSLLVPPEAPLQLLLSMLTKDLVNTAHPIPLFSK